MMLGRKVLWESTPMLQHLEPLVTGLVNLQHKMGIFQGLAAPSNQHAAVLAIGVGVALVAGVAGIYIVQGQTPWGNKRHPKPLTAEEWHSFFDTDGRLLNGGGQIVGKVRRGGVAPEIQCEVWPFLLGVHALDTTERDRKKKKLERRRKYLRLRKQVEALTQQVEVLTQQEEDLKREEEERKERCVNKGEAKRQGGDSSGGQLGVGEKEGGASSKKQDGLDLGSSVAPTRPGEDSELDSKGEVSTVDGKSEAPVDGQDSARADAQTESSGRALESGGAESGNSDRGSSDRSSSDRGNSNLSNAESNSKPLDTVTSEPVSEATITSSSSSTSKIPADQGKSDRGNPDRGNSDSSQTVATSDSLSENTKLSSSDSQSETPADQGSNASQIPITPEDAKILDEFRTSARIIRLDAVRMNAAWIPYAPTQANCDFDRAAEMATSVGLENDEHLEPARRAHAARLVAILEAYAVYDKETGYCQGMSDLLSPFVALIEDDAEAFWCFQRFMRTAKYNFRLDEKGIRGQLNRLAAILEKGDPELYQHLAEIGAGDCIFAYRMVVVLFRRELSFEQTLSLWEVCWADALAAEQLKAVHDAASSVGGTLEVPSGQKVPTSELLLYTIAAAVAQRRRKIIDECTAMDEVLKECNGMANNIDLWRTLKDARVLVKLCANS